MCKKHWIRKSTPQMVVMLLMYLYISYLYTAHVRVIKRCMRAYIGIYLRGFLTLSILIASCKLVAGVDEKSLSVAESSCGKR